MSAFNAQSTELVDEDTKINTTQFLLPRTSQARLWKRSIRIGKYPIKCGYKKVQMYKGGEGFTLAGFVKGRQNWVD